MSDGLTNERTESLYCYGGLLVRSEKPGQTTYKTVYGWRKANNDDEALGKVTRAIKEACYGWSIVNLSTTRMPPEEFMSEYSSTAATTESEK